MVHKHKNIATYFYRQDLVLFTVVPSNINTWERERQGETNTWYTGLTKRNECLSRCSCFVVLVVVPDTLDG